MIQFANPLWLWGLTGIAIPLGIHLLSRKEGKTIYIGSIRHLRESDSAQFSSIRLNEILLLLIRCFLITLLVMFLAGLQIRYLSGSIKKWVVVENALTENKEIKPFIDSLVSAGYELRSLENVLSSDKTDSSKADYWSIAENLSRSADDVVVISYSSYEKFKGLRVPKPANVRWLSVPDKEKTIPTASVLLGDSVWSRLESTSPERTAFETQVTKFDDFINFSKAESDPSPPDSIRINIYSDFEFEMDEKIITASLKAIQTITPRKIIISHRSTSQYQENPNSWSIWLSRKTMDTKTDRSIGFIDCSVNSSILVQSLEASFICKKATSFSWIITKRLNQEVVLQFNFTQTLASLLLNDSEKIKPYADSRAMPEKLIWSAQPYADKKTITKKSSTEIYLVVLITIALLTERWVAFKRNQ
jgi:hypothetical protein